MTSKLGVGLIILTSPLSHVAQTFRGILPQAVCHANKLIYVQILPGCRWPLSYGHLSDADQSVHIASWSRAITAIYNLGSTEPALDLRVLLTGIKNPFHPPLATKKPIETVFVDSAVFPEASEHEALQEYIKTSFGEMDVQPTSVFLSSGVEIEMVVPPKNALYFDDASLPGPTDKILSNVCLGGTFDRLHVGHKILLTEAILRCSDKLTVGVASGDDMLRKKTLSELISPTHERVKYVKDFIEDVDPSGVVPNVLPIVDPYGPAIVDGSLEMIIGSDETSRGCAKINAIREERHLEPLRIHLIEMSNDMFADHDDVHEDQKVSSSSLRMRVLGTELRPPLKAWNKEEGPYVIGLTGGSASGKTSISKRLEKLGAGVVDCDLLGHRAYEPGTRCYSMLLDEFGKDRIVVADGANIDRTNLSRIVFSDTNRLRKLESILWPEILSLAREEMEALYKLGKKVVILDAAVLLSADWDTYCHQVWVAFVDRDEAIERIMKRDGKTKEDAQKRLANQWPNGRLINEANVVFCTKWDGDYTQLQVERAWNYLIKEYIEE